MSRDNTLANETNLGPLKINAFGERYFYNLNRGNFDKVSSQAWYDANFSDALFKTNNLTIIIGTDSGLLPLYIRQKGIPSGSRFIFIEPDDILEQLLTHNLLSDLPPEIGCTALKNWEEHAITFKMADYFYITAVQSLNSVCAQEATFAEYPELSWLVTEKLSQYHWNYSMSLGSETFIIRQLNNLADNLLPASLLSNAFKNQTAIILAGGPSLDEALPWVKHNRDRITLFAVSRIARQLQQINIQPDFIFSVDPTDLSFDISKEMLTFSNKPIFVHAYHTVSTLVNQWPGTALYLGERLPWKSPLNQQNITGAGPTVTNTAIATAHAFGFSRIILAGVDLCFTRSGYTHAQGSNEALSGPRFNLTSLQIETNSAAMAPTSCDFLTATNTLAIQAQVLSKNGCQLINASAHAAKIAHISHIPLCDIELTDSTPSIYARINDRLNKTPQQTTNDHILMLTELKQARYQIKMIHQLAEKAARINDSMYNQQGIIENYKDKRQLDKIEQKLQRQYRKFSSVVKQFGIRHFIKITRPFEDNALTADQAKELGNIYYTAYRDGSKIFLSLLDNAIERIYSRMDESQEQPDIQKLLIQWKKDQSYGRANGWYEKYKHPIPDALQKTLQDYVQQFDTIIANTNTRHLTQTKNHSSLSTFKNRAKLLFKHGKTIELNDLKTGLDKYPDQEAAADYQHLATAYIADLEGDTIAALHAYQQIIDDGESTLFEDALMRIAQHALSVEDHHNAHLALQCLAQLSPMHLPLYAEINRLLGNTAAAIDIYCDYINQFPSDILVQLKLAVLHIENQAYAAATVMLDYVLSTTPNSKAALELKAHMNTLQQ